MIKFMLPAGGLTVCGEAAFYRSVFKIMKMELIYLQTKEFFARLVQEERLGDSAITWIYSLISTAKPTNIFCGSVYSVWIWVLKMS